MFAFLQAGCSEEMEEPESCRRTLLFYLGGDNNLSDEIEPRVNQIMATRFPSSVRVLIYADTWKDAPVLMEVITENGKNRLQVVHRYEENNSADPLVWASVLQEMEERYPSPSYGLVLFSHATGWLPEGSYNTAALRSVVKDKNEEMELADFAYGIPDRMFDFIIFETCHMAGIEVAWELKDKTSFIIASSAEIVSPGFVPIYPQALPCLCEPEANLKRFIEIVAEDYKTRQGDYGSLTLSLIDTGGLEEVAASVKGCAWPLPMDEDVQTFDRYGKNLFFDFYDAFSQSMTSQQAASLRMAVDRSVVYKVSTEQFMPSSGGFDIVSHSGLTTYIPQKEYPNLNDTYKNLKWYKVLSFE